MKIFNLKQDLQLPLSDAHYTVFPEVSCGVSYSVKLHIPTKKEMLVDILVVNKETGADLKVLRTLRFTETGIPIVRNEEAVAQALTTKTTFESELEALVLASSVEGLTQEEIDNIQAQITAKETEIADHVVPAKVIEMGYTYVQAAALFDINGDVTPAGIQLAHGIEIPNMGLLQDLAFLI